MLIDCERCVVRGAACEGCVVTMLLQPAPGSAGDGAARADAAEAHAIETLTRAGFDVTLLGRVDPRQRRRPARGPRHGRRRAA